MGTLKWSSSASSSSPSANAIMPTSCFANARTSLSDFRQPHYFVSMCKILTVGIEGLTEFGHCIRPAVLRKRTGSGNPNSLLLRLGEVVAHRKSLIALTELGPSFQRRAGMIRALSLWLQRKQGEWRNQSTKGLHEHTFTSSGSAKNDFPAAKYASVSGVHRSSVFEWGWFGSLPITSGRTGGLTA
jgi:hypothetical protein